MKWTSRLLIVFVALCLSGSAVLARNILEKKMYYYTYEKKSGEAKFWALYLGNYNCKLTRKYPGEGDVQVDASVNLQMLSSGYVEGNGYCAKGKLECLPTMTIKNENGSRRIEMDSIDFIYNEGQNVQLKSGEKGEFVLDLEGNIVTPNRFILREYKLTEYFGEQILKEGSQETALNAISLSKDGIARAQKAMSSSSSGSK
jgi:hypothetical protein